MKKLLIRVSFFAVVLLSYISCRYVNSANINQTFEEISLTEIDKTGDKLIGSVKSATVLLYRAVEILTNRHGA